MSKDDVTDVQDLSEQGGDPIQELDVVLQMKVKDVNVLLALLAKLPYEATAQVIESIRMNVLGQIQEQQKNSQQG